MNTPTQRCGACGIPAESHHIVNHIFVNREYKEFYCPTCGCGIQERFFKNHVLDCGIDKPFM